MFPSPTADPARARTDPKTLLNFPSDIDNCLSAAKLTHLRELHSVEGKIHPTGVDPAEFHKTDDFVHKSKNHRLAAISLQKFMEVILNSADFQKFLTF